MSLNFHHYIYDIKQRVNLYTSRQSTIHLLIGQRINGMVKILLIFVNDIQIFCAKTKAKHPEKDTLFQRQQSLGCRELQFL